MTTGLTAEESAALREQMQGASSSEVDQVNLASQERNIRKHFVGLSRHMETFSEHLRDLVTKSVWQPCPVKTSPLEIVGPATLTDTIAKWAVGAELRWPKLGVAGYVGVNHVFAYALIELAYGAPSHQLSVNAQALRQRLTEVERRTLEPTLATLCKDLATSLPPADPAHSGGTLLSQPFYYDPPQATTGAVAVQLEFPIAGGTGIVWIVLLSQVLGQIDTEEDAAAASSSTLLAHHLASAEVTAHVQLGTASLLVSDLATLKPGTLLWLDRGASDYLPVLIEDKVKFLAQPLQRNGTLGVKIVERVP